MWEYELKGPPVASIPSPSCPSPGSQHSPTPHYIHFFFFLILHNLFKNKFWDSSGIKTVREVFLLLLFYQADWQQSLETFCIQCPFPSAWRRYHASSWWEHTLYAWSGSISDIFEVGWVQEQLEQCRAAQHLHGSAFTKGFVHSRSRLMRAPCTMPRCSDNVVPWHSHGSDMQRWYLLASQKPGLSQLFLFLLSDMFDK